LTVIVGELSSGDVIRSRGREAIYIAQCRHPLYRSLQLVIWRLSDGSISLDALDWRQDVGEPIAVGHIKEGLGIK
jgi:hypothetical protein